MRTTSTRRRRPLALILGITAVLAATSTTVHAALGEGSAPAAVAASGSLDLPRIPWEGGPQYWTQANGAQFAKADAAGWDDPSFFPITVFYGKADPSHLAKLKDAGINTLAPVEHSPEIFPMSNVSDAGLFAIPSGEWSASEIANNPNVVGHFIADECDQGEGACWIGDGDVHAQRVAKQQGWVNEAVAGRDGRFTMANYGNGILRTYWSPGDYMNQFVQMVDVASADKYTYTSPGVWGAFDNCAGNNNGLAGWQGWHDAPDWPNCVPVARAYSYGWQADQMRRFQDQNRLHPAWTFIETHRPYLTESTARNITADQISGAVWSALIHEARGISYFQHNNATSGCTGNYSIVECPTVHAGVKAVNAKVKSLAPVLNTQSYYNTTETVNGYTYYRYRFNNGTDTMLKTYSGSAYVFASLGMKCNDSSCSSGTVDQPGSKTFQLPAGVHGTSVEVVGENRTIPVVNGTFSDTFAAEYSNHVYRISLSGSATPVTTAAPTTTVKPVTTTTVKPVATTTVKPVTTTTVKPVTTTTVKPVTTTTIKPVTTTTIKPTTPATERVTFAPKVWWQYEEFTPGRGWEAKLIGAPGAVVIEVPSTTRQSGVRWRYSESPGWLIWNVVREGVGDGRVVTG